MKYPCASAVKVTGDFNEILSTSVSPETVWRIVRAAELNGHSIHRNFFVRKRKKLLLKQEKNSKYYHKCLDDFATDCTCVYIY